MPREKVSLSPMSIEMVFKDGNATVLGYMLKRAEEALATDYLQDRERSAIEAFVQNVPLLWNKFDMYVAMLPDDIRGDAGVTAAGLIGYVLAYSNLMHASDAARRKYENDRQRSAGKRSGESRKVGKWVPRAKDLACSIRARYPTYSQARVAETIKKSWGNEKPDPPSHDRLVEFVRELEREGDILRRQKRNIVA
jgi:hypothetical protein